MMQKLQVWISRGLIVLTLLTLAGCSGKVFDRAYTASGQGMAEADLTADEQFTSREDLNVVIKLNRRGDSVNVRVVFIDPNGDVLEEIERDAPKDVGTVVMGLDYEGRADVGNQWLVGRYEAQIYVDGEQVQRLFFRVD